MLNICHLRESGDPFVLDFVPKFFGSTFAEEDTPVPIPNTAVKLFMVDGTVLATVWESRTVLL